MEQPIILVLLCHIASTRRFVGSHTIHTALHTLAAHIVVLHTAHTVGTAALLSSLPALHTPVGTLHRNFALDILPPVAVLGTPIRTADTIHHIAPDTLHPIVVLGIIRHIAVLVHPAVRNIVAHIDYPPDNTVVCFRGIVAHTPVRCIALMVEQCTADVMCYSLRSIADLACRHQQLRIFAEADYRK